MQSIFKALVYGLALEDRGDAAVLEKIGVEPSGDAFNAISLKPVSGTPFNPMINAGAIATCGQVQKRIGRSRIQRIQAYLSGCAGRELALMAATLANQGVNPLTRHQAIAPDGIDNLLSVMSTCGMYDFSGEWIYRVGLPAKSGVAGGIMAVLPGLRLKYDNTQVRSRRRRPPAQRQILAEHGRCIRVLELQGDLVFSSIEPVLRSVHQQAGDGRFFVLNLRSVISADDTSLRLLAQLQQALAARGIRLFICHARALQARLRRLGTDAETFFGDDDRSLEECENLLLSEHEHEFSGVSGPVPFGRCELLEGLAPHDISWLDAALRECRYEKGEKIVCAGDPGDLLFLLQAGSVEVRLPGTASKPGKRIDVFTAGMTFGEMAFIDGSPVCQPAAHQCGGVGVKGMKLGALSLSTSAPAATASAFVVLKMAITMTIASTETTTEAQATRRQVLITGRACARRPEPTAPDETFIIIPHLRMQVCPLQAAFQETFRPVTSNLDPPCHAASWRV